MTAEFHRTVPAAGDRRLRATGAAAVASGLLVLTALLAPRVGVLNAFLVILGVVVSPVALWGLLVAGLGRSSQLAQRVANAWFLAYAVLLGGVAVGELLRALPGALEGLLVYLLVPAIVITVIAGPLAGVICLVKRELTGWRRWIPLVLAVSLGLAVLPGVSQQPVSPFFVLLLPICLVLTGAALLTFYPEPVEALDEE